MKRLLFALPLCLAMLTAGGVHAGQACEERAVGVEEMRKSFGLALKVREALDRSGARVVVLGRVGQDLSKYGLRYSHAGVIWRDHPQGRWLAVHELNECGTTVSTLYNQGLANFFADDLFAWDALVLIPSEALQQRLVERLAADAAGRFHQSRYNMVAYPFSSRYQNSNQWVLELMAEALADTRFAGRDEAQAWLKANGYVPTTLHIPALTRLGGRMFKANVAFDDHPTERRMDGKIDTVTVESIATFLAKRDSDLQRVLVRYP
ncbi:MAG: DUF2145 domain-containing protein [Betaproteobacteria bacterium]